MTTYHVWLTGRDEPEVVRADFVRDYEGTLLFFDQGVELFNNPLNRTFQPSEWTRWAIVHDEPSI
jgi:hypothetical protein